MWWICGLINIVIVILGAWFFDRKIKHGAKWTLDDKCTFGVFLFLAFFIGVLGTLFFVGIFVYLIIDFVKYRRN